jgi:predicted regulator of Ras-like GTPase activity (Roadblock/LC7/MglB family)
MSDPTPRLSSAAQNLSWLLNSFVQRVPGVSEAIVLSADGLPMAVSDELDRDSAERFAAVASGLVGLAYGAAGRFGGGRVNEVIVEMEHAFLLVTGAVLTPELRAELQGALLR